MKIGLITTLNTNIGDDLIREGICLVLREVFKKLQVEFVPINKHQPMTVYPDWHPVHLAKTTRYLPRGRYRVRRLIEQFAPKLRLSRFDTCDLIVYCGAPVLWQGCHQCEWAKPLWHQVVGRLSQRIPVLNLAAGSCYPWEKQPTSISDPKDATYLRTILGYCQLTTVRDKLAQHLCSSLGTRLPLIACSAFLAARNCQVPSESSNGVIVINYMSGGGHYDWTQGIDTSLWQKTMRNLLDRLRKRHQLVLLCHDEKEYKLAQLLDPTLPRLWPKNSQEYFAAISKAKVGLCNRMHASVALAGLGIPSIAVCTDTRLLMVSQLGLPIEYVKTADIDMLEDHIEKLIKNRKLEKERLLALQKETWERYINTIGQAVHAG